MSTSLSDVPAQIARQDVATGVLGPYLVGCVLNLLLGGVYLGLFSSARADLRQQPLKAKAVSWAVFALMVCCIVMAAEELVDTGVSQKRSAEELFAGPPQSNVLPLLGGVTGASCQAFLMWRAAALMPSRPLRLAFYAATSTLVLLALAGATLFSAMGFILTAGGESPIPYFTAEALWLWPSAFADILISAALAQTLHRRIAGFNPHTDGVLWRLIVVALQTAALTSVVSIAGAAVSTALEKSDDVHASAAGFAFWLPLPALHAISLFTTLSSRRHVQAQLSGSNNSGHHHNAHNNTLPLSVISGSGGVPGTKHTAGGARSSRAPHPLVVTVQREQAVSYDDGLELDVRKGPYGLDGSASSFGVGEKGRSSDEVV